ncbi:PDZ domain-containing protein [Gemmata sp.]|uniref:PDZ domain-containing protein n=1 Tax=Gemmata sp. TaxID=1914242 RepID=UPI003F702E99
MRWPIALVLCGCLAAPALAADKPDDKKPATYEIPYRLTDTKHVLVRAKLNGKGPFNLILDTGAPAVFITKAVAKRSGADLDDKGWGTFDTFEVEGGLKVDKVKTRVEDLVQIEGMNSMGLAGVELHGVIGYNVLAKFRVEYDFTADKLAFVELKGFEPPGAEKVDAKGGDDIQSMGPLVKMLAALSGIKPNFEVVPRGFVGVEFDDTKAGVVVKKVLAGSPAERAGFKTGDVIEAVKAAAIGTGADLAKALAKAGVGTKLRVSVKRGDKTEELTVELGKGL